MSPVASLNRVFSVPELAESVAQHLRPHDLLTLSTLSRTLHRAFQPSLALSLPSFILPSTPGRNLETLISIAPRVRTLSLILLNKEEDPAQQRRLLDIVNCHYRTVQQVHVEYWGRTIDVAGDLLFKLSSFQKLSIAFKAVIDAEAIFHALIARSKAIAEQSLLDDAEAKLSYRYRALQSLSISYLDDFWHNVVLFGLCKFARS